MMPAAIFRLADRYLTFVQPVGALDHFLLILPDARLLQLRESHRE